MPTSFRAAIAALALLMPVSVTAQQAERPGETFRIAPTELPQPNATPSANNSSRTVQRRPEAGPQVPPGFQVNIFADGLANARWLTVAPNGDVFLAEPSAGRITVLRDADGDGRAEVKRPFMEGQRQVHGMAIQGGNFYFSNPTELFRVPYKEGDLQATAQPQRVGPQNALGDGAGHFTRNLAVAPDGRSLFVAVGSRGNEGEEPEVRASVQRFNIDGTGQTTFGSGLRNPVGIAFRPGTNDLYVVVNERDGYGDGLVPDYLTRVQQGDFFGWPYSYIGTNPAKGALATRRADLVAMAKVPDVLFQAHSAPLGLAFYDGTQFPAEMRGDAFVALHGSWNAGKPTGYKVVRVPFRNDRPTGEYINFATGFWTSGTNTAEVWGRPVGIVVAKDGSLLVADDVAQVVWRIAYRG